MTAGQHLQRCETCGREHTDHLCKYRNVRLAERDKEFLEVVGCASHSSAGEPVADAEDRGCYGCLLQSDCNRAGLFYKPPCGKKDQQIRRQERERVLDALSGLIKNAEIKAPEKGDYLYPGRAERRDMLHTFSVWIESLRQQGAGK